MKFYLSLFLLVATTVNAAVERRLHSKISLCARKSRLSNSDTVAYWNIPRGGSILRRLPKKTIADAKLPTLEGEGTASIPNEVFNLIKSIVGAGVLGLPAGIAAFGDAPSAIFPAMILLTMIGSLSAYGFSLIGVVMSKTQAKSYRQAWAKSVGEKTSWMPALACLLVTTCSVLCYSMILADTIPSIVEAVTGIVLTRTEALLGITMTTLLPLCLMKNLSSLAPFSLVGILGMVYTCTVMMLRWLSGSYAAENGKFTAELVAEYIPRFGSKGWRSVFSRNVAIMISMMSTAFMAHYNAPKFYWELQNNTITRFNRVVALSFAAAVLLMATTAMSGFGTFGGNAQPLVLNNYAVSDQLMFLSRIAVAMSLIFSYPLAFVGVREGLLDLIQVPVNKRDGLSNPLTVVLLTIITGLAWVLKDIGIILALGGATWGNAVIYLFPALMLYHTAKKYPEIQKDVPQAVASGLLGLVLGAVGTTRALQSI